MIGSAIILASATAFTVGRTGISFAVHNVFEIILVSSIIVYSCYYGLVQTHRLPFPFRRRAARRFFALQAGNFAWVILMLVRNRVNPQLEGALVGAAAMFFFNVLLVLWAHRYLPHLEITVATATEIGAAGLRREFGITKREEEVIRLICEGLSNKEIANRLYISVETVKDHNHNIFRKTGVSNRVQLANLFR